MSERINKKLAEISSRNSMELKSEAVELSIIEDGEKLASNYFSKTDKLDSKIKGISSAVREAVSLISEAEKLASFMPKTITKIEGMAKELGVNPSNIKSLGELKIAFKDVKQYSEIKSNLNKLL